MTVVTVVTETESHDGFDEGGLAEVVERVRGRGGRAQLCVLRDGRVVLDRTVGCRPDALFWLFSTSKPYVAMCVHLLAERGALALDDPVAAHWPEFGRNGKEGITVRHVLRHRAGIPVARGLLADALAMTSWTRAVRAIEDARPVSPPGEGPAYHIISFGFILGEIVRRVSGVPVDAFLASEILAPLGLRDTYLGLPRAALSRRVPVRASGARGTAGQVFLNRRSLRRAVIPAAGVSATARDVARFYQMLLGGGELDGVRVLAASTVAEARRPSTDRAADSRVPWAQGFQLGGPVAERFALSMGRRSSPETFGHNGSNACMAWADPGRRLVFAYVSDRVEPNMLGVRHQAAVADALLAAYRPA